MGDVAQKVPAERLTDNEQTPATGTGRRPPIPKRDLEDQAYYAGICRNAYVAQWHADKDCFMHLREKFGNVFAERIKYPDDEKTFDYFTPWQKIYPM
jgi:hypothetical protein